MQTAPCDISQDDIARRAYEIWQSRGCPAGDGTSDWEAAVAELTAERGNGAGGLRTWIRRLRKSLAAGRIN